MFQKAILMLVATVGVVGCGQSRFDVPGTEVTPDERPFLPPGGSHVCDYCVRAPSATFTGPSSFYRGTFENAPDCQEPTPIQGIQGFLTDPTPSVEFVRECLITPSDTCSTEGKVCAPFPDEDFQTCVHHTGDVDCPPEYDALRETILVEGQNPFILTLCCMSPPGPA